MSSQFAPCLWGGNTLKAEDDQHKVYEGTGTGLIHAGRPEVTIVERDGTVIKGHGDTIQEARDDAWQKHDLASHRHD